jgi:para-aminobenzoate synthetase
LRLLIVDNYDSFTLNLAHAAAQITGSMPEIVRNDECDWAQIDGRNFDAIIISPGPGHPANARDFGVSAEVIRRAAMPVLGVCLGHQGIALEFGGILAYTEPAHGVVTGIRHDCSDPLFDKVPSPFDAVRYHSLTVADPLPAQLRKLAWTEDGAIMALRHVTRPLWGVQFHPESILTGYGLTILANFLRAGRDIPPIPKPKPSIRGVRCAPSPKAPADLFRERFADKRNAFWLDSSLATSRDSNSFMGCSPESGGEIVSYRAPGQQLTIDRDGRIEHRTQSLFDFLDESLRQHRVDTSVPFPGGYVGYFGYELRSDCGSPRRHVSTFPDAMLMRVDDVIRIGHSADESPSPQVLPPVRGKSLVEPILGREEYLERIQACLAHISRGEAYELCLTNHLNFDSDIPALRYYEALRRLNPAPYSAYLRFGDLEIACASPECFLRVDSAGHMESRPIKGTAPRSSTVAEDDRLRHLLATDARYRAENLMITDLVRHDLGRVARPASVRVPALMEVESYATVHQLVSTVTAELGVGLSAVDALRAAFPGGSMTGAPKLRAMELLDQLEPTARGIYSGSIGYLGFDGSADLNIVIRTAIFHRGRVSIGTGGAIIAQSDPQAEWDETKLKTAALLRAFNVA